MQISQAMLIYLVLQKSDEQTNKKWKESLDFKTLPTWGDCVKVLERHCQYLESMEASHTGPAVIPGNSKAALSKVRNQPKGYSFTCSNTPCSVCSSTNHKISNCDRFKSYNITQRFDQAKKMGLCINCLSKGHQMAQCPSTHRCKVCSKQHHSLLHRGSTSAQQTTNPPPSREAAVHTHMHNSSSDNVILATAMILVRDSSGDYRLGKALLDSCSQVNFITEEFAQRLSLPKGKQNIEIQGIANDSLDAKLEKLWRIEEVAVNAEPWTREQTTCEQMYRTTVSRNPAGRIVVKLPFKDDPSCLGDSYTTALRRFNAQERRLAKLPHLRKQYVDFMDEYERLGHMSIMENPNLGEPHYYIPHHCVLKPTSTTTKLRVVFDASCRTTTQISLNEIQMVGPTIQNSQVVLHWLKMHSITLSAFVGNRVSEIQDLTTGAHWRYVPTHSNPADIVSRGCTVAELASSIWYTGPTFLYKPMEVWPKNENKGVDMETVEAERRKSAFTTTIKTNHILEVVNKKSSYTSSIRLIGWMFRFANNLRPVVKSNESGPLSSKELHHALLCIIWNIQQEHFANDIHLLQKNLTTNGQLRYLNPFLESVRGFQLLRVGGRLKQADIPEERKHPLLLPSKCEFIINYVRHLHHSHYHAGPKALVALIRLKFWIINAREVARRVVRSCIHCVRYKPKLMEQVMGHLPVERLTPSRPFARCGIDFCGPVDVYLRIRGKIPYKAYIAIFVCLATKAVHIEIVSNLSTEAAPHFGGIWEAAVKSAKGHLNRSMANSRLTYEELTTALVEIEAVMNSRPITPLSSDPNDYEALTPGHFIIGDALKALPERNVSSNISHAQQWAQIATIKQNFWKQWSHEYINELQVRSKWFADRPNIENNTMVIIHEDNLPPQKWLMGRIVNCIPGKDSKIRVVDVRTSKGIIRRPIHKLAVLPV
ncbi:uncharacterized protein LOC118756406 [Rhagoletis pomonella]|uniref:uncharacterized protein LOC118756406 n=1 Tax=Rhagoletis pomonella TaxID=28610 RepID=UPI00177C5C1C|nr:uncharacterized protein LOC118756406 [Rhagoletis pomonella]